MLRKPVMHQNNGSDPRKEPFLCHYSSARPLKYLRHNLQPTCTHQAVLHQRLSSSVCRRRLLSTFPVVDGACQLVHRHVFEANLQNSQACQQRYDEVTYTNQLVCFHLFPFLPPCSCCTVYRVIRHWQKMC